MEKSPDELIEMAEEALKAGDVRRAADLGSRVLENECENTRALRVTGTALFRLKDFQKAEVVFEKFGPESADSDDWLIMAIVAGEIHGPDRAAQILRQALKYYPGNERLWSMAGTTFRTLKEYDRAVEAYGKALEINGDFFGALWGLGLTLGAMNLPEKALPVLEKVVELAPETAPPRCQLGLTLIALGRRADARSHLKELEKLDPSWAATLKRALE